MTASCPRPDVVDAQADRTNYRWRAGRAADWQDARAAEAAKDQA